MREAQDFVPRDAQTGADLDVGRYLPAHRTPVLKHEDPRGLTAAIAQQQYHDYAQQQFLIAGGTSSLASQALMELGKTCQTLYQDEPDRLGIPTASVFYRAAVAVDQQNALAANELAVLMANSGQLPERCGCWC